MTEEIVRASLFATSVYLGTGAKVQARKGNGVWYVVLPPHPRREECKKKFEEAGVTVLAEIRQA
jgi:hypothetical protein